MLVEEITKPNGRTQATLKVELRGSSLKHSIFLSQNTFFIILKAIGETIIFDISQY